MPSEGNASTPHNPETIKKDTQPQIEKFSPPVASSVEVHFARQIEDKYDAIQNKQDAREKRKIIIERITIFFVFCSLVVNVYMWTEMRKTTEATKLSADAAAASTAAWIVLESWGYKGIEQEQAIFNVILRNVGKTPATEVKTVWEFAFMPTADIKLIPKFDAYQCPKGGVSPAIVAPDEKWENTVKTPLLTPEQLKMATNHVGRIFIHGCVIYHDVLSPHKERITEIAAIYPSINTGKDFSIYDPYNRMK